MQTLLLVAGRSRRFWPLAEKSLVPLTGKTLLAHQLEHLKAGGCTDVVLVCGKHNKKEVKRLFPEHRIIEQQDLEKGMQGALLSALPKIKGPVMVVGGNDVIEPGAYRALLKAASRKGVDGALLAQKVKRYFPGGYLSVKRGKITNIVEKPGEGNEPSKLVNIVAHVHQNPSALLKLLKEVGNENDDGYERALAVLFREKNYVAVPYEGTWQAVKYPWHLLSLLPAFLEEIGKPHISRKASVHPTAVVEGRVIIEDDVRLLPHAAVIGPCYIGRGSIIGNGALVRGSSIGERCVVGFGTEVKGSVLMDDVWTHMTYIGDSVIGSNVSFGGGCMTGNFRLDEGEISSQVGHDSIATGLTKFGAIIGPHCRLGIQVGTNPGIKIGSGSFVAGGTHLKEDIPEKSFVSMKDGKLFVRENRIDVALPEQRKKYVPKK